MDVASVVHVADLVSKVTTTVATIVAGCWAYFQFLRGRVLRSRVTLNLEGRQLSYDSAVCVACAVALKNVGLTKVEIKKATLKVLQVTGDLTDPSSGKRIHAQSPRAAGEAWCKELTTLEVLLGHDWIEPGESVHEAYPILVPLTVAQPTLLELVVQVPGSIISTTVICAPSPSAEKT